MNSSIISQFKNLPPGALWTLLVVSIALTGLWRVYKLHPTWSSTRHKIATEKFDRLCNAYEEYQTKDPDSPSASPYILKFEGALRDHCKTPIHHRVGDMALQADSPTQVLETLKKVSKSITYEDGRFKTRYKPHRFPSDKTISRLKIATLISYIITATAIGVPLIAFFLKYMSFSSATLASISLGYVPGLTFIECMKSRNRAERLKQMANLIKSKGGLLYGENTSQTQHESTTDTCQN